MVKDVVNQSLPHHRSLVVVVVIGVNAEPAEEFELVVSFEIYTHKGNKRGGIQDKMAILNDFDDLECLGEIFIRRRVAENHEVLVESGKVRRLECALSGAD